MKVFKVIMKGLLLLLLIVLVGGAGFIGYAAATDYRPELVEDAEIIQNAATEIEGMTFKVTTFNIGYAGLDKDQDFFMDGGTMSRSSSLEQTNTNLDSFISFIETEDSDFFFLQEVDEDAIRSFGIDQKELFSSHFSNYTATFSYNFKAKWVPVPLTNPIGDVSAGLMNLSKFKTSSSTRYQLPGEGPWPQRYVDLDRCVMEDVFVLEDGSSLYMINIHLSAYDKGGTIRAQQVQFLIDYINDLYAEGDNYIIFGGDWNHLLDNSKMVDSLPDWVAILPDNLFDTNFQLAYDTNVNTVRSDDAPYEEGVNFETVIDGFLVSPNIQIDSVVGHDLGFENSDHNPVSMTFTLK